MYGNRNYYTNPAWVNAGDAPSNYKDIVYRRPGGSPNNYGFFMTQNPAHSSGVRRAGMRMNSYGAFGAPAGSGKIPCISKGSTDASVAKAYPELGSNWVTTVQTALRNYYQTGAGKGKEEFSNFFAEDDLIHSFGTFDSTTKKVVEAYQKSQGFGKSDQDGIVGPMTYKKLFGDSDRYLDCSASSGSSRGRSGGGSSSAAPPMIGSDPWYTQSWFYYTASGVLVLGSIAILFRQIQKKKQRR